MQIFKKYFGIISWLIFSCQGIIAQQPASADNQKDSVNRSNEGVLFHSDDMLKLTITGRLSDLYNDRGTKPSWHPLSLQYKSGDQMITLSLKAKTRGHFRKDKANCKIPPILLNFSSKNTDGTIFENQDEIKLVMPCKSNEYVVREYLVYKLYNLVTPKSFNARLAEITFRDSNNLKKEEKFYCFLIEDESKMARRNYGVIISQKMAMENTSRLEFTRMAVFQYLIGNTDWSVTYQQNIKLLYAHPHPVYPVPYDFDHAGIVDAPYAGAAPELGISSIRERIYRGYCNNITDDFTQTIGFFNGIKKEINAVYQQCDLLDRNYTRFVLRYIEDFYKDINDKNAIVKIFNLPCRTKTRVEIKGLKK
ncbi:hypothetical protein BH20BAC1_BH20BAC1_15320 [soil metagenome]